MIKFNLIYKVTNLINGKIYVGKHSQYGLDFDGYLGSGTYINKSIRKYGKQNFKREILEIVVDDSLINEREKFWISSLKSTDRQIGYNITFGGDGADTFTNNPNKDITRQKISEASKRYSNRPEVKSRVSKETSARWNDPEWKEKQVQIQTIAANEPIRLSKISEASKKTWENSTYREEQVRRNLKYHYVLRDPEGNIHETDNLYRFCKSHGLTAPSMVIVCSGKVPQHKNWTCVSKQQKRNI